jgi:MFS family permease
VSFWTLAGVFVLLMFAVSAPSPLYSVYQANWRFSDTTLTAVFAIYAIALLLTLLFCGALSDHLGRRPVILSALAIEVAAMAMFITAHQVSLLLAARALQGVATGAATGALSAGLIELQPAGQTRLAPLINSCAPSAGIAVGALATSALVQYAPAPMRLVFWLLVAALVVGAAGVAAMAEPGSRRPGALASLRPRAGVPAQARRTFLVALPGLVSVWALGGFYLSLGPSVAATLLDSANLLWGGLAIFLVTGTGAAASILLRASTPQAATTGGCLALLAGLSVTVTGIATSTGAVFLAGSAIAGLGFGLAFLGVFRTLSALATPSDRAALIATIYAVSYLAFSLPVVIAGIATTHAGLHDTSLAYAGALIALVAVALAGTALHRRRELPHPAGRPSAPHHDLPPCPGTVPSERLCG